ncbi:glycine cleavage system protein GcvH [Immundisolibacter sp.]|uniref:glycine cleavage system protein GcvH n=1 Tax=Immundisolibacter sp. TaxID=1934948 RepID=UPI0026192831|nr:glycine cleavage system protein GcvH [Immundisolibacter sp.]MDD3651113.1 glycine cleavage system protein GcvH [Immundisolibacter sp.]
MSQVPDTLRYTETHEWLRQEADGSITVGITDHAQAQLGDLVYVELPAIGKTLAAGEACAVVESVKAAADVYAPLAGTVLAVNEALAGAPELVNEDPYGAGWLLRLSGALPADLLDAAAYRALTESA